MSESYDSAGEQWWQRRIAYLLRRFPWTGKLLQWGVRLVQPRFTLGVIGVLLDAPQDALQDAPLDAPLDAPQMRVLLVEHVFHTRHPWGLPGGWMNRGEDPAQTVEREFYEETGLKVRAVHPLVIQRGWWSHHMDVVFLCVLDGGDQQVRLNGELLGWDWFPVHALPPLAALHRNAIQMAGVIKMQGVS